MRTGLSALILGIAVLFASCKKDDNSSNNGEVIINSNPTEGQIVLSTYTTPLTNASKTLILDKVGTTLYEKTFPSAAINFRKWQVNGKTRYTYMQYDSSAFKIAADGSIIPCTAVVLNENYQEIKRLRLLPFSGRTASDPNALDAHDFIYLDDNHYITLSYYQKPVTNIPASLSPVANCKVVAAVIQEVVNDAVVWEWDSTQYPEFYLQSVEGNAFNNANVVHDYVHMNSIFVDPNDNGIICSLRNTNQVIKINRTDGHIVWRLGGTNSTFPLAAGNKFLRQHNATLTDNNRTLLLFDNGEIAERAYSRVMEFHFTDGQSSIDTTKAFTVPLGIFGRYMGSVQKRGDTYFIGCGSTPKILEVNYKTNEVTFLMNLPSVCYRAMKS